MVGPRGGRRRGSVIDAATPAHRVRAVDAYRALAILAVVVGHWLVAVPMVGADGAITGQNVVGRLTAGPALTWVFQVMPLVFAVGGYAAAVSLRRSPARPADWVAARLHRLLTPVAGLAGCWLAVVAVAHVVGVGGGTVAFAASVATVPLWFLAAYVVLTALAPWQVAVARRHPVAWPTVLVGAAVAGDVGRIALGVGWVASLNFVAVYALHQEMGIRWAEGRLPRRRTCVAWAGAALGAAALLVAVGPWPTSMIGVPGDALANNAPPSMPLLLVGCAHVLLAVAAAPWVERLAHRPLVWATVAVVNMRAMTVLCWHFTALAVGAAVLVPLGARPGADLDSVGWWLVRLPWIAVLAVVLVGLVRLAGRWEERRPVRTGVPTWQVAAATSTGAAACATLATAGLGGWAGALAGLTCVGVTACLADRAPTPEPATP